MNVGPLLYLVTSFGGRHAGGALNAKWFKDLAEARAEVKQRLGVNALHMKKRLLRKRYVWAAGEDVRQYDGFDWHPYEAWYFSVVVPSHPDAGNTGGVTLYVMERRSGG